MHPGARTIAAGVLVFVSLAVFIPGVTEATLDTPQILSYQGRLTDAQKVTVADGAQSMKFAIFDASAGGTCLWSAGDDAGDGVDTTFSAGVDCPANVPSTAISVSVTDGLFNVLLGASPQNALPDSLFNTTSGQERWLEIRIGAETLTPRRRLVSSASALQAGNASLLDNFDTSQVGGSVAFVPVTDSSGNLVLTKNLTVDTSTLFVDSSNNRVGVGFLTGTADLSVTQDAVIQGVMSTTVEGKSVAISRTHATASTERTVSIQANLSPTGAGASIGALNVLAQSDPGTGTAISGISGGFLIGEHLGTGTATTVRGIFAQARSIGGTVTSLRGMDANALAFGASAVATDAIAIHGQVTIATSASVTNGYAILAKNTSFSSGTYTNQAGIAIEDQTVATNRTNLLVGTSTIPSGVYSIYNSSSSDNYFAGNVGIGTTAPGEKLVVSGGNISLPTAGSELKFTSTSIAGPTGYLRMRSNASGLTALAVMPNVTQGARNAILDFYNTDYSADATNYEALSFYSVGSGSYANITNAYTIGSKKGGTGSSRPLLFGHWNAGETTFDVGLSVATSGYVGVGTQNPSHRLSVADAVAGDTVPGSLRLEMTNSAAVGGNGLGFGTDYYIENSNGNINAVAQTQVVLDDATEGSEDASFRFRTRAAGGALTERVRIDSTGNVGVGTTAPNTALDINGAFSVRGIAAPAVSPAGQGRLYFDSTSNTFKISQNAGAYADIATTGTAFVNGGNSFAGTATLGTNDNNILAFETNNVERGRFEAGGNFMVGATALGSVHSTFSGTSWANNNNIYAAGDIAAQGAMFANSFTAGDSSTVYSTSSAVSSSTFTLQSTGSLTLNANTSGGADDIVMTTAGSEKARLLENGNFGIGTASAGAKLQVTSTAAGTAAMIVRGAAAQTANLTSWQNSAGSTLAYVDSSGNVTSGADFLAASTASLATGYTTSSFADSSTTYNSKSATIIPSDGNPVMAWTDSSGNLKVRKCTASDCSTSSATVTLKSGVSNGSLYGALAPDGNPFFTYGISGNVGVAHCTSQSCASADTNDVVVDTANTLGSLTATALISASSAMAIAFTDGTANDTKYVRCDNPTAATPCTSVTSTVTAGGDSDNGGTIEMVIVGDGTPLIFTNAAAYGSPASTVAYKCSATTCASTSSTTLSGTSVNGGVQSAAVGPDGFGLVITGSYSGAAPYITRCTNNSCSTHSTISTSYEDGNGFFYNTWMSVVIPADNKPVIWSENQTNGYGAYDYFLICADSGCSSFASTDVSPDAANDAYTGRNSIGLNPSGDAVVQYGHSGSTTLVAKIALSSVLATGTDLGANATRFANGYFSGDLKVGSLTIDGTGGGQGGFTTVGSATIGDGSGTDRLTVNMGDNSTDALDIQQGSNNYININTTNSSENISFGNTTTAPSYTFLGAGRMSIGTSSPAVTSKLAIEGSSLVHGQVAEYVHSTTKYKNFGMGILNVGSLGDATPGIGFEIGTRNAAIGLDMSGTGDLSFSVNGSGAGDYVAADIKMVILPSGNVGIGTTAPETILEIQGAEAADAIFTLDADEGDDNADTWFIKSSAADNDLTFVNHTSELVRFTDAGNVGIGTTTPLTKLDLSGNLRTTGKATAVLTGSIDPAASTTVIGLGTLFLSELVIGDRITVSGETRRVAAIASDTSLTVETAFSDNANDATPDVLYALATMRDSSGTLQFITSDLGDTRTYGNLSYGDAGVWAFSGDANFTTWTANSASSNETQFYVVNSAGNNIMNFKKASGVQIFGDGVISAQIGDASHTNAETYFVSRMGIGTSSPSQKLHVLDSNTSVNILPTLRLDRLRTSGTGGVGLGTSIEIYLEDSSNAASQASQIATVWTDDTDTSEDSDIIFSNMVAGALTESLRIDGNGRVGIGTAAPITKLDVGGDVRISGRADAVITGSINPTASALVTGASTLFTTELKPGDSIDVNGEIRTVVSIASNTSLTVDDPFTDTANDTSVGVKYAITSMRDNALAAQFYTAYDGDTFAMGKLSYGEGGRWELSGSSTASTWKADPTSIVETQFYVQNSSGNDILRMKASNGLEILGNGTTSAHIGDATGIGQPTYFLPSVAIGTTSASSKLHVASTSATNGVQSAFRIDATLSSGVGAVGLGSAFDSYIEDSSSALEQASRINTWWNNAANGGEDAEIDFWNKVDGTLNKSFTIAGNSYIGVGVSNPNAKLQVQGLKLTGTGTVSSSGTTVTGTGTSFTTELRVGDTILDTVGYFRRITAIGSDTSLTTDTAFNPALSSEAFFYSRPRFMVQEDGNVGIGDPDPTALFTVGASDAFQISSTGVATFNASLAGSNLTFVDTTPTFTFANASRMSWTDGTNNLATFADLNTNFGLAIDAGAFISRNSAIAEEFSMFRTALSADTAGAGGTGVGDNGGWGVYEEVTSGCTFTTTADAVNGTLNMDPGTTNLGGCLLTLDDALNNARLILDADNLPVILMKVRTNGDMVNDHRVFVGMSDTTDGTSANPANGIGFVRVPGTNWAGYASSGGSATTASCGIGIGTGFALLKIEVRANNDVHYFIDADVSDGVSFTECGSGISTNIPTAPQAPQFIFWTTNTGSSGSLDVDFFRAWQDDAKDQDVNYVSSAQKATDAANRVALAQLVPAKNLDLAPGSVVSMDPLASVMGAEATVQPHDPYLLGVVVRDAALVLGNGTFDGVKVATAGRVAVKVSDANGAIKKGDWLTSSSIPGVAVKATTQGAVLGYALQNADTGSDMVMAQIQVQAGYPSNQASQVTPTIAQNFQIFGDLDFAGYSITNIKSIRGQNWSIDETGALTVKTAKTGAIIITKTDEKATLDSVTFPMGSDTVFITNPAAHETSEVFLSWQGNPGSISWVQDKHEGGFTVKLAKPTDMGVKMSYWIVDVADERVAAPVAIPSTDPASIGVPAETTTPTAPAESTIPTAPAETTTPTAPAEIIQPTTLIPPGTEPIVPAPELVAPVSTLSEPVQVPATEPPPETPSNP